VILHVLVQQTCRKGEFAGKKREFWWNDRARLPKRKGGSGHEKRRGLSTTERETGDRGDVRPARTFDSRRGLNWKEKGKKSEASLRPGDEEKGRGGKRTWRTLDEGHGFVEEIPEGNRSEGNPFPQKKRAFSSVQATPMMRALEGKEALHWPGGGGKKGRKTSAYSDSHLI